MVRLKGSSPARNLSGISCMTPRAPAGEIERWPEPSTAMQRAEEFRVRAEFDERQGREAPSTASPARRSRPRDGFVRADTRRDRRRAAGAALSRSSPVGRWSRLRQHDHRTGGGPGLVGCRDRGLGRCLWRIAYLARTGERLGLVGCRDRGLGLYLLADCLLRSDWGGPARWVSGPRVGPMPLADYLPR